MQSVSANKMSKMKSLYINIVSVNEIRFFTVNLNSSVNPKCCYRIFHGKILATTAAGILP